MNFRILTALLLVLPLLGCMKAEQLARDLFSKESELETVQTMDPERYVGTWYAVASFEHWFEEGCTCSRAEYWLKENGRLGVRNYCVRDGEWDEVVGEAWPMENGGWTELWVDLGGLFNGKYFIVDLDEKEYSYSIVGTPDRNYLWVLSRSPEISPQLMERLKVVAGMHDFEVARLETVRQQCAAVGKDMESLQASGL
jgi:apolipoprotein D and lipocalin family protein